jgi:hypothetical protein
MGESSPLFSNMSSSELEERSRLLAKLYDCREELESRYEKISNLDDSEELGEAQMLYLIITVSHSIGAAFFYANHQLSKK